MSVTEISLSVLNYCLVLLYAHQKLIHLEIFPDSLTAGSLKLTRDFVTIVFSSTSVLTGIQSIILPCWPRVSSSLKERAEQELLSVCYSVAHY